ncbi:MAG TPA: hypothetical protein VFG68_05070 [Fimbriiglobus sp.]|nr:hypothetical protein [Fimbriiglobus sp.]
MLRLAVTLGYVMAAVLVPKVCCCALQATTDAQPQRTAAVTEVRGTTCPHCRPTHTPTDSKPTDKPKCPCKDGRSQDAPAVVTAPASQWLAGPDAPTGLSDAWAIGQSPVLDAVPFLSVPRTGPPLTADDLLRAFHILRC